MADKDSSSEIAAAFKLARRRPISYALQIAADKEVGMVLETHIKKAPSALKRLARKNGGSVKGASGTMTVDGRVVQMQCEEDGIPGTLPKAAKKHFRGLGFNFKFVFILPNGETLGDPDDDAEEAEGTDDGTQSSDGAPGEAIAEGASPEEEDSSQDAKADEARKRMVAAFKSLNEPLRNAITAADPAMKQRLSTLAKTFGVEIKGDDMRKAAGVLQLLKKSLDEVGASGPGDSGPDPEAEKRRAGRSVEIADVERSVDELLARFSS